MALIDKVLASKVSRRDFLKGSAAAIGAASAALVLGGCSTTTDNDLVETTTPSTTPEETTTPAETETSTAAQEPTPTVQDDGGKWVAAACWHNCGGKCLVRAYVKDGVIIVRKRMIFIRMMR